MGPGIARTIRSEACLGGSSPTFRPWASSQPVKGFTRAGTPLTVLKEMVGGLISSLAQHLKEGKQAEPSPAPQPAVPVVAPALEEEDMEVDVQEASDAPHI